jgi:hypothetical protein
MIAAMILAKAMPLWQAVSPDIQQAIQDEVRAELGRRGAFYRGGGGPGGWGVLIPFALFAMVVLIVWIASRRRQEELRARAEFQKQILDKFGSGKEFAEFLGSEGSQRFLESLSSRSLGSQGHILRGMRAGITVSALGFGFLLLSGLRRGLVVPGVLLLALGIGALIAAAVSYHFSKKWTGGGGATPGQPLSHG